MSLDKTTVAKRYSRALFDLLVEKNQLESGYEELQQLRQIFSTNPQLAAMLADPSVDENDREAVLKPLLAEASEYIKNFIQMVYDYGRTDDVVAIVNQFQALYDQKKQIVHADVTTAVPLTADQSSTIAQAYATRVGAKQVLLNPMVNADILGGVIVQSADTILDGSLRTKLQTMSRLLRQ